MKVFRFWSRSYQSRGRQGRPNRELYFLPGSEKLCWWGDDRPRHQAGLVSPLLTQAGRLAGWSDKKVWTSWLTSSLLWGQMEALMLSLIQINWSQTRHSSQLTTINLISPLNLAEEANWGFFPKLQKNMLLSGASDPSTPGDWRGDGSGGKVQITVRRYHHQSAPLSLQWTS